MERVIKNKYEIYLEIALFINKNMYGDKKISYELYRVVEDKILKKIDSIND